MYPGKFAATSPEKPAVIMAGSGDVLSYRELNDRSIEPASTIAAC